MYCPFCIGENVNYIWCYSWHYMVSPKSRYSSALSFLLVSAYNPSWKTVLIILMVAALFHHFALGPEIRNVKNDLIKSGALSCPSCICKVFGEGCKSVLCREQKLIRDKYSHVLSFINFFFHSHVYLHWILSVCYFYVETWYHSRGIFHKVKNTNAELSWDCS